MRREGDRGSRSAARLEWRVGAREPREGFEHGGSQGLRCGPVRLGASRGRGCRSGARAAGGVCTGSLWALGPAPFVPTGPRARLLGGGGRRALRAGAPHAGARLRGGGSHQGRGWSGSSRGVGLWRLRGRVRGGPGPGGVATRDAASGRCAEIPAPEPAPGRWGAGTRGGPGNVGWVRGHFFTQ